MQTGYCHKNTTVFRLKHPQRFLVGLHRTTILISSACNIINDYSKLFIVAIPNKTIKILPYLVTRAKSPLLVHISRSIDAFATAKQPYESSWECTIARNNRKVFIHFFSGVRAPDLRFDEAKFDFPIFEFPAGFEFSGMMGAIISENQNEPETGIWESQTKKG